MSTNTSFRPNLFRVITVAGIALLLLLLWRQQSDLNRLKKNYTQLQEQAIKQQNHEVPSQQTDAPATTAPGETRVNSTQSASVSGAPTPHADLPGKNRLIFSGTEVTQTTNGLMATLHFKASKTGPLGLVLISVRLPNNIEATIQTLGPVGSAKYEESETSVSDNGRFATFQGTLGDEKDVAIALGVSGVAHAFIRGSCGIPSMELDIQSTAATATPFGR